MPTRRLTAAVLEPQLKRCGYGAAQLETGYSYNGGTIPLAAFADKPFDVRSACINVLESAPDVESSVAKVRDTGAPVVFTCHGNRMEWWKQTPIKPEHKATIEGRKLTDFFDQHRDDFAPETIYEGKTRCCLPGETQLHFVDAGLMPMVERETGEALSRLVKNVIGGMEQVLGKAPGSKGHVEAVFKSAFWLLAAKMLRDKQVNNFKTIKLTDIDDVFRRVGRHYGDTNGLPRVGKPWRTAIEEAAATIDSFGHLGTVSTEAFGYLYENTLVPDNVRKTLGIHRTPSYVVDYMVWQLWPWIEGIVENNRNVFEPACGHAAFLVGAMRLLRQWSSIANGGSRHDYLKRHLQGVEVDPFALEIAKLSLTLADIPHGNSWKLKQADMFDGEVLKKGAQRCHILLANPPYERFSSVEREAYRKRGAPVSAQTKAVEMLARTIPHLTRGGVFGVVVPQGMLHSAEASRLRVLLMRDFEIAEIALFADNLFEKSDHETAIILGRRTKPSPAKPAIRYRRVRENGMEAFRERLAFSLDQTVPQAMLASSPEYDMRLRELDEVWAYMHAYPRLSEVASVGQGLIHHGAHLPPGAWTVEPYRRGRGVAGFADVPRSLTIFGLPERKSLNLDKTVIRRPVTGATTGIPQVLVNYAPVSRDPWRLKAVFDERGHAVTSRFLTVRRKDAAPPLEFLWALLNSPLSNAFAYCWSDKRQTLAGTLRTLPLPTAPTGQVDSVIRAAKAYLELARQTEEPMRFPPPEEGIKQALVRMDAEVLRLYDLPPRLERQLLDLFEGVERRGVGCDFRGYYPEGLDAYIPLHELISDEYQRSTLDAFLDRHEPVRSPEVLAALRAASEAYTEE